MRKNTSAAGRLPPALKCLALLLAAAAVVWWVCRGVARVDETRAEEGRLTLERSLCRAAVTCYAGEGVYPPTLEYLTEHYGVSIDEDRYAVHYDIFAENIMPEITVVSLKEGGGTP